MASCSIINSYQSHNFEDLENNEEFEEKRKNCRSVGGELNRVDRYYDIFTTDVRFLVRENGEDVYVGAHKAILASDSSVFREMFFVDKETIGNMVEMKNESLDIVDLFLQSFYNTVLVIKMKQIARLVHIADKFKAKKCQQVCESFLLDAISMDNKFILAALELSIRYNIYYVRSVCAAKIEEFGYALVETEEFTNSCSTTIELFLKTQYVGRDEFHLLKNVVEWAIKEYIRSTQQPCTPQSIKPMITHFMRFIRVDLLSPEQIRYMFKLYQDLFSSSVIKEVKRIYNAKCVGEMISSVYVKPPELLTDHIVLKAMKIPNPSKSFQNMLNEPLTVDLTLVFGKENMKLSLHRCILATKSVELANKLYHKDFRGVLNVDEYPLNYNEALEFCKPFYGRPTKITIDNYSSAVRFCKMFLIEDEIENFQFELLAKMNLSVDNVFHIYDLGEDQFINTVFFDCMILIVQPDFDFVRATQSDSFLKCQGRAMKFALEHSVINGNQMVIFENLINWAQNQYNQHGIPATQLDIRAAMQDFFELIRFDRMNQMELTRCLSEYKDLFTPDEEIRLREMVRIKLIAQLDQICNKFC